MKLFFFSLKINYHLEVIYSMGTKIYDKISYHREISTEKLIRFFEFILQYSNDKSFLNNNGKELLDHIDFEMTLHNGLFNASGNNFMLEHYDYLARACNYNADLAKRFLQPAIN